MTVPVDEDARTHAAGLGNAVSVFGDEILVILAPRVICNCFLCATVCDVCHVYAVRVVSPVRRMRGAVRGVATPTSLPLLRGGRVCHVLPFQVTKYYVRIWGSVMYE